MTQRKSIDMTPLLRRIVPALLAIGLLGASSQGAEIRDNGRMFSAEAVAKAQAELTRVERETGIPITIETIEAIPGLADDAPRETKLKAVNQLAVERDREIKAEGIYLLLSKNDRVISNVLTRERYARILTKDKRLKIRDSFIEPFKAGDFDGGLARAAAEIAAALPVGPPGAGANRPGPARRLGEAAPVPARPADQQHGVGSLFMIALGILAVLFVVRLLSGALGGNRAGGYPQQMGMGRPGPGMGAPGMGGPGMGGPGYGPGYGGRGGGFFSGLMGGIGGALAGNWLYNQFSGNHSSGHSEASSFGHGQNPSDPHAGGDGVIGADDDGGHGASWGDSGGDWGGGGDWGDSGGDW